MAAGHFTGIDATGGKIQPPDSKVLLSSAVAGQEATCLVRVC